MKKFLKPLLLLIVPAALLFSFQQIDKNFIEWNPARPLTWKDFKGTQEKTSPYAAITEWTIYFSYLAQKDSLHTQVTCYFDPAKSKVKHDARKDSLLLRHEQYHFNLAEVYARKFRKALEESAFSFKDANTRAPKLYSQYVSDCKKEQDLYDKETDHSQKTADQKRWEDKID
ncbi:MAG TPA: hypothetical protein VFU15_06290, partial [Bacteroidia bacterium]|nr:hypothetical protein [Bacteroidia bacterium]